MASKYGFLRTNLLFIIVEVPGGNAKVLLSWTWWVYDFNCSRWPNSNMLLGIGVTTLELGRTSFLMYFQTKKILIGWTFIIIHKI